MELMGRAVVSTILKHASFTRLRISYDPEGPPSKIRNQKSPSERDGHSTQSSGKVALLLERCGGPKPDLLKDHALSKPHMFDLE